MWSWNWRGFSSRFLRRVPTGSGTRAPPLTPGAPSINLHLFFIRLATKGTCVITWFLFKYIMDEAYDDLMYSSRQIFSSVCYSVKFSFAFSGWRTKCKSILNDIALFLMFRLLKISIIRGTNPSSGEGLGGWIIWPWRSEDLSWLYCHGNSGWGILLTWSTSWRHSSTLP